MPSNQSTDVDLAGSWRTKRVLCLRVAWSERPPHFWFLELCRFERPHLVMELHSLHCHGRKASMTASKFNSIVGLKVTGWTSSVKTIAVARSFAFHNLLFHSTTAVVAEWFFRIRCWIRHCPSRTATVSTLCCLGYHHRPGCCIAVAANSFASATRWLAAWKLNHSFSLLHPDRSQSHPPPDLSVIPFFHSYSRFPLWIKK